MKLYRGETCRFNPAHIKKFYVKWENADRPGGDEAVRVDSMVVFADDIRLRTFEFETPLVRNAHFWKTAPGFDSDAAQREASKKAWAWLDKFVAKITEATT